MSQILCHLCIAHGTVRRASACILQIHGIFSSFSPEGMLGLTGLEESHHRVSDSSTAFLCNWHCSRSTSTSLQTRVSVLPTVKELVKGLSVTTEQGQKASIPLPFLSTCLMWFWNTFLAPLFLHWESGKHAKTLWFPLGTLETWMSQRSQCFDSLRNGNPSSNCEWNVAWQAPPAKQRSGHD